MRLFLSLFLVFFCIYTVSAQVQTPLQKAVNDAFMVTRMAEKFHVQPKPLDDVFSASMLGLLLQKLDDEKIYFTQQDITALSKYQFQLDDLVKAKQSIFLQLLTSLYKQRIQQVDTMVDNICKQPFNITIKEQLTVVEDTTYASNTATQRVKIYKLMKLAVVQYMASYLANAKPTLNQKKFTDSIEPILRHKVQTAVKRPINKLLLHPNGIDIEIGNSYCEAIAECYDPHSEYFSLDAKADFESELGKKPSRFGFALNEDEDGKAIIADLAPGSSAYKSGQLNKGDKITGVQWEGQEKVDVLEKDAAFVNDLFDNHSQDKMTLTVKKADGSTRQVILQRQVIDNGEEDDKVKSFILKGEKSIGYISLPAFYEDWEDQTNGVKGCANDVAKEIIKLKKENIQGLIIDVRYNGGGSLQEAVDLAGIFIDAGPVGQMKDKAGKVYTLKDMNRGTIFDGPLAIMVNGYSASASEMLAGTLQDYNRAVIVGAPTFGKATAQVVLPMDTTINLEESNRNKRADSYLKLTMNRLYRVNGTTAQATGVIPDIVLPDVLSARAKREADEEQALIVQPIDANKYYKPNAPLNIAALKATAATEVANSKAFADIISRRQKIEVNKQPNDQSLLLADAIQQRKNNANLDDDDEEDEMPKKDSIKAPFTIVNHSFETKRLDADSNQKTMNDGWKDYLLADPYLQTTYKLLLLMK
jgi:carboxyl-terminal processing protease